MTPEDLEKKIMSFSWALVIFGWLCIIISIFMGGC